MVKLLITSQIFLQNKNDCMKIYIRKGNNYRRFITFLMITFKLNDEKILTEIECANALKQMQNNKSPLSDGLTKSSEQTLNSLTVT